MTTPRYSLDDQDATVALRDGEEEVGRLEHGAATEVLRRLNSHDALVEVAKAAKRFQTARLNWEDEPPAINECNDADDALEAALSRLPEEVFE